MDPVSVFRALFDSKCIRFGQFDLESPYDVDLNRLSLYPRLMDAIAGQVVERFLTPHALASSISRIRKQKISSSSVDFERAAIKVRRQSAANGSIQTEFSDDADSQLEEDAFETGSEEDIQESFGCSAETGGKAAFRPILSGVPYGAVPLAATVAFKAQLPYLFERKGVEKRAVDGGQDKQSLVDDFVSEQQQQQQQEDSDSSDCEKSVILIEDVIRSGESILRAVRSIEQLGLKVEFVVCVIDREENGVNLLLEQHGIKVFSLYNISAILRVLEITGRITDELFIGTRRWITSHQFSSIGAAKKCSINQPADNIAKDGARPTAQIMVEVASN